MTKPFFCICLLQLGCLLTTLYISTLLIMSVSVTLDTVDINQILFKFLWFLSVKECCKYSKILNTFLFLQNAYKCSCSPSTDVVKVVPEVLYMISFRQQFYRKMRQASRDRKISDSHRKGQSCPMCEKFPSHENPGTIFCTNCDNAHELGFLSFNELIIVYFVRNYNFRAFLRYHSHIYMSLN